MTEPAAPPSHRLIDVTLAAELAAAPNADADHERRVAIFDLLEENRFGPADDAAPAWPEGPYRLALSIEEGRLVLDIAAERGAAFHRLGLSLTPFRRILKDYFLICESYFAAIKTATPAQIEALDQDRRKLHFDGADVLRARLEGKVALDAATARRLFTLIGALHYRG